MTTQPDIPASGDVLTLAREAIIHLREDADFNRSWADGRRGSKTDSPGYIARRIQVAEQRDAWADAIESLIASTPAAARAAFSISVII